MVVLLKKGFAPVVVVEAVGAVVGAEVLVVLEVEVVAVPAEGC